MVRFELVARDPASGDPRYFHPVFQVGRPGLEFERYYYSCPPALPGETKAVRLCVRNRGHGWGHDAWARLTSLDPNVTILAPESIPLGELAPGSSVTPADSFRVAIENSCPGSWLAAMQLSLRSEACAVTDTFSLLVGAFGFADDMESGGTRWTHGGTGDRWNLSTYRQHSGTHAWYCGDNASHRYSSNMNAWLQTVPFMVAEHCSLRFWRWFSVPNYGVDGIYVVVLWGGVAETLDFMGTGGALGDPRFGIESDWYEEKYDLGWIPVGETIQVKVSFKSDNDGEVGEGFYIDDFRVTGGQPPLTFIAERPRTSGVDLRLSALPSPFSRNVRLRLSGLPGQTALIRVYDAGGRIVNSFAPAGRHGSAELVWHGSDAGGRRLPAGAYFIEARAGDQRRTAKVLMTD
ncbi:hypothetical protein FJY71_09475 [candidate division WOR-3 bacterium]|nr:hypothetical protein [candidate division WOR-3 bacterium]